MSAASPEPATFQSLLAQLVAVRQLPPEPVATDALVHLLTRSSAARNAITDLANVICPEAHFSAMTFGGQEIAEGDTGRPDIVGNDANGRRLILEAKFDAALTAAQLDTTYLDRLPGFQPGILMYLAPPDRLPSLWPQLLKGPGQVAQAPPPNLKHQDESYLAHPMGDGRVIAAISWPALLARLQDALITAEDHEGRADLAQIAGLVEWRSRAGWVPYVPGDLPDRTGRQLVGLRDALVNAAASASAAKMRNGSGDSGPGRWISTPGGRWMWVGLWLRGWDRLGISPAWLTVEPATDGSSSALHQALEPLTAEGGPGVYPHDKTWAVPLMVPIGAEQGDVTQALVHQIQRVAALLDATAVTTTASDSDPAGDQP